MLDVTIYHDEIKVGILNVLVTCFQGCHISREICLFPGRREILGNTEKYGKYWEI